MMRVPLSIATVVALLASVSVVGSGQDARPDNLSVTGSVLSWRDNSAGESGFQVSIMPVGGQAAPVFTHVVAPNSTSFDLASDPRACSGPIAVGVAALFPDGAMLNAGSLVEANIMAVCAPSTQTPTVGTPVASATARPPTLPSTGHGDDAGWMVWPYAVLVVLLVASAGAFALSRTQTKNR